jgi:hypothetical protein
MYVRTEMSDAAAAAASMLNGSFVRNGPQLEGRARSLAARLLEQEGRHGGKVQLKSSLILGGSR